MVDLITEVDAFHGTSDWLSMWNSTPPSTPVPVPSGQAPGFRPTVPGQFYYRNMHFSVSALSLVVCCGMFGVYTAEDTARVLYQQQQHPPFERKITTADVKGVLQKIVLENSNGYQTLKAAGRQSSLVRGILAPMVAASCVRMRTIVYEYEVLPTWYRRSPGPRPPRLPLVSIRCRYSAEDVNTIDSTQVRPEPGTRVTFETADDVKTEDSTQVRSESAAQVSSDSAEDVKSEDSNPTYLGTQ